MLGPSLSRTFTAPLGSQRERVIGEFGCSFEDGTHLVDLPDAPLPEPDTPAPVRFLPHWDANLLVHARRTGLLPEPYRSRVFSIHNPFSVGTYLVDGVVAGAWSVRDGRVELDPYDSMSAAIGREVEREREALEAFHA